MLSKRLFLVLFGFVIGAKLGTAATITWTGSVDNNWHNECNWNTGVVPGCSDDVIIPTGVTNYPDVPASTTACCNSLTINLNVTGALEIQTGAILQVNSGVVNITGNGSDLLNILGTGEMRIGTTITPSAVTACCTTPNVTGANVNPSPVTASSVTITATYSGTTPATFTLHSGSTCAGGALSTNGTGIFAGNYADGTALATNTSYSIKMVNGCGSDCQPVTVCAVQNVQSSNFSSSCDYNFCPTCPAQPTCKTSYNVADGNCGNTPAQFYGTSCPASPVHGTVANAYTSCGCCCKPTAVISISSGCSGSDLITNYAVTTSGYVLERSVSGCTNGAWTMIYRNAGYATAVTYTNYYGLFYTCGTYCTQVCNPCGSGSWDTRSGIELNTCN